jgi:hypothetical protein
MPNGFTHSQGVRIPFGECPVVYLAGNHIHGGDNQSAWGIDGLREDCVVEHNVIIGGACATPNSHTCGVRGGGGFILRDNNIHAGTGASAAGVTVNGDRAVIVGNTIQTPRGGHGAALLISSGESLRLEGNQLDGVLDDVVFGSARRLTPRTWTFNHVEDGVVWSHDTLTLNPWGWLHYGCDASSEPTGGGYAGCSQTFQAFLTQGPPQAVPDVPSEIVEEIRALLLAAGADQ